MRLLILYTLYTLYERMDLDFMYNDLKIILPLFIYNKEFIEYKNIGQLLTTGDN